MRRIVCPVCLAITIGFLSVFPVSAAGKGDRPKPVVLTVLLVRSTSRDVLKKMAPYRDGLVVHQYRVKRVKQGEFRGRSIRIATWGAWDAQPITEAFSQQRNSEREVRVIPLSSDRRARSAWIGSTLPEDIDATVYYDVDSLPDEADDAPDTDPRDGNYTPGDKSYRTALSEKIRDFYWIRGQVKLVAIGDSRGQAGINAELFYGKPNRVHPVAFNLSTASSGLRYAEVLIREYLPHCPKLEWVLISLSPRELNRYWSDSPGADLSRSPGVRYDRKTGFAAWKDPAPAQVRVDLLKGGRDLTRWGWHTNRANQTVRDDVNDKGMQGKFRAGRWSFACERWLRLKALVELLGKRGVKVLVFIPPMHPAARHGSAVDDDGTPRKEYSKEVARLKQLTRELPNCHFLDVHDGGNHDFPHTCLVDQDHLNASGAERLTGLLDEYRRKVDQRGRSFRMPDRGRAAKGTVKLSKVQRKGYVWATLDSGARIYDDRTYKYEDVPDAWKGAKLLQTRNDDKRAGAKLSVRFSTDRGVQVAVVWPAEVQRIPEWLMDYRDALQEVCDGKYRLYLREFDEGTIELGGLPKDARAMYGVWVRPWKK